MNKLCVALEESLPVKPLNPGRPQMVLRHVLFVNTHPQRKMSLKQFCDRMGISYQGCIEQIVLNHPRKKSFMQIVAEMRARADKKRARLANRVHDCPHCRCARTADPDQVTSGASNASVSTGEQVRESVRIADSDSGQTLENSESQAAADHDQARDAGDADRAA